MTVDTKADYQVKFQPPEMPLASDKHERYAQFVASGLSATEAYQRAIAKSGTPRKSCANGASKTSARPEVAARLTYLEQLFASPTNRSATQTEPGDVLDRRQVMHLLSERIRSKADDAGFVTSCNALIKMLSEEDRKKVGQVNVTLLADHLLRWAGMETKDILKEVGGLPFLMQRICEVLHMKPARLAAELIKLDARIKPNET